MLEQLSKAETTTPKLPVIEQVAMDKNLLAQASKAASLEMSNRQLQRELDSYKLTIQSNRVLEEKIAALEARLLKQQELQVKCSQLELELEQVRNRRSPSTDLLVQAQYTLDLARTRERIGELQATIHALSTANTDLKSDADRLYTEMTLLRQEYEQTLDSLKLSEVRSQAQVNEIANLKSQLDSLVPVSL